MYSRLLMIIVIGCLLSAGAAPPLSATATPHPTPTLKVRHMCEEELAPAPTPSPAPPRAGPLVRAVMFWMNTCPHCHEVIEHVLPPLQEQYGEQLEILLIEVVSQREWDWLAETGAACGIPEERLGVPFLVIGDRALMGSQQISAELPGLIEGYMAAGGVDYPDVPGLAETLPPAEATATLVAPATAAVRATPSPPAQFLEGAPPGGSPDPPARPNGFGLAVAIMAGMIAALFYTGVTVVRGPGGNTPLRSPAWPELAIPLLALAGLGVAGYLAYVETQAVPAVCGPVGDCNAVPNSPYARLFGVLLVGVLGAAGYVAILAVWLWGRLRSDRLAGYTPLALLGLAVFGVLFSLYLTYLEPFVIRAVCAWCLTSAVIITLLMLFSLKPALQTIEVTGNGRYTD